MNIRIFFLLAMLTALAASTTGCCTYLLVNSTHYKTQDTFNPSAIYETSNLDSIALEGTRFKDSTDHGRANPSHVFVILPKGILPPPNLQSNLTLSMDDIRTLPPDYIKGVQTKKRLPANYTKAGDLPANNTSLVVKEHHPRRVLYVFVPVTVAVDVATSPIQLICLGWLFWWESGTHC